MNKFTRNALLVVLAIVVILGILFIPFITINVDVSAFLNDNINTITSKTSNIYKITYNTNSTANVKLKSNKIGPIMDTVVPTTGNFATLENALTTAAAALPRDPDAVAVAFENLNAAIKAAGITFPMKTNITKTIFML